MRYPENGESNPGEICSEWFFGNGLMKILGIDPGSLKCGYGLIGVAEFKDLNQLSAFRNQPYKYLSSGRIVIPARQPLSARLRLLHTSLQEVIAEFSPDEIAIEKMFFAKGVKAALSFGHARGVVLLAAALSGLPIYEYSALEVKKAVVGYGRADKNQVQKMVCQILAVKNALSSDSADALALAVCHCNTSRGYMKAVKNVMGKKQ